MSQQSSHLVAVKYHDWLWDNFKSSRVHVCGLFPSSPLGKPCTSSNAATALKKHVFGTAYWDCFECLQWCSGKTDLEAVPVLILGKRDKSRVTGEKLLQESKVMRVGAVEMKGDGFKRLCEGRLEKCQYLDMVAKMALVTRLWVTMMILLKEDGEGNWFGGKDEMFVSSGNIKRALGLEIKREVIVRDYSVLIQLMEHTS